MILRVSKLKSGENPLHFSSDKPEEVEPLLSALRSKGYEIPGPVDAEMVLTKLEPDYYLRGRLRLPVRQPCSRCGEPAVVDIDHRFEIGLVHTVGKAQGGGTSPEDREELEALDLTYFHGMELDLAPILEEQFYLSLPLQPVCQGACSGELGENRQGEVFWKDPESPESGQSPFSVLRNLKVKKS